MKRWDNQEEAFRFAMARPACMLDMDMGTGKTRVAIDVAMERPDVDLVLVVCPKSVIPVWRHNLMKFHPGGGWTCIDDLKGTVTAKSEKLEQLGTRPPEGTVFVVMNYDIVWRHPMDKVVSKMGFDMVILDESHRAKAAGTKVSRFLAGVGKKTKYRMCLSGTPMSNSPLDLYGQYRFLDPSIFGTSYSDFRGEYAIMNNAVPPFVIGFKNQHLLLGKFQSIAYTCKMTDIRDQLKLPDELPPVTRPVSLPSKDLRIAKVLAKQFIAECEQGVITVHNVLHKVLRLQQMTSGFAMVQDPDDPLGEPYPAQINTAKEDALVELLRDVHPHEHVVVFCVFTYDLRSVERAARTVGAPYHELSGSANQLGVWNGEGGVLGVQVQSGAEGVDMTASSLCVHYSLPQGLAIHEQSKARLYRPGAKRPVSFVYLLAEQTIDEIMYRSLINKKSIIDGIRDGSIDMAFLKRQ